MSCQHPRAERPGRCSPGCSIRRRASSPRTTGTGTPPVWGCGRARTGQATSKKESASRETALERVVRLDGVVARSDGLALESLQSPLRAITVIHEGAEGGGAEPGTEIAGGIEALPVAPRSGESFLRDVVRVGVRATEWARNAGASTRGVSLRCSAPSSSHLRPGRGSCSRGGIPGEGASDCRKQRSASEGARCPGFRRAAPRTALHPATLQRSPQDPAAPQGAGTPDATQARTLGCPA
jgi:hypothetical protein